MRLFFPSLMELVEAYPAYYTTEALHKRPSIWFTVKYDCCSSLCVNSFEELCVVISKSV